MKDAEINQTLMSADETEKLQASFVKQQEDLESRITAAKNVSPENLTKYFSELDASLQQLQRLYSASSPYLRIYYRKIYQDALQSLQTKIQETEIRLLPPKKFVFKGNRIKNKPKASLKNGEPQSHKKIGDQVDGLHSCVYRDLTDTDITIPSSAVTGKKVVLC